MVARKIDHLTGQVKTMSGRPLLHDAAQYGDVEQAEEQLRLGADLNGVDGSTGVPATPLWISAQTGMPETVELFLKAGADKDWQDPEGKTAVWIASRNDMYESLKLLIEAGADLNLCNMYGETPVYVAAQFGFYRCLEQLLAAGAECDVPTFAGHTPLYVAADRATPAWTSYHADCVKMLLDAGASKEKVTNKTSEYMPFYVEAEEQRKKWEKEQDERYAYATKNVKL